MAERIHYTDEERFDLIWIDKGREPQCAPNPDFPDGKPVDVTFGERPACRSTLPCPAPRCGIYVVTCKRCGQNCAITTAGRPDDPNSIMLPCRIKAPTQ